MPKELSQRFATLLSKLPEANKFLQSLSEVLRAMEAARGFLALGIGLGVVLALGTRKTNVFWLVLVSFFIRVGLSIFHYVKFCLPDSHADAIMFEHTARQWAAEGWGSLRSHWQSGALLYSWVLAFLYLLLGPSALLAQAFNVLLGTFAVYLIWVIASEIFDQQKARVAGWIACFFPTLNLYSALTMREALFVFLTLYGVLFTVRWFKAQKLKHFVWATIFLVLATGFHLGAWPLLWALGLWSLGVGALAGLRAKKLSWKLLGELACVGAASAFIVIFKWGWDKGAVFEVGVGNIQQAYAIGRAAYLQNLVARNILDLFWQAPIRIVFFLFTPFPWMVKEPRDLIGFADAILYVLLVICTLWSLMHLFKTKQAALWKAVFLLSLAAIGIAAFATITSNYGAAIRHRAKFVPFLLVASVPALFTVSSRGRRLWERVVSSLS
ncbi:MAG: glycosyltransferase family 39 protein [Candidatus Bipolaricaulaceae bacterium]